LHALGPIIAIIIALFAEKSRSKFSPAVLAWGLLPCFVFFMSIFGALQYGVGTDYFSYIDIYNQNRVDIFTRNNEYISAFYINALRFFDLEAQYYIAFYAVLQALLLHVIFFKLSRENVSYGALLALFLIVTGLYFNQLNQLRQFTSFYFALVAALFLVKRKWWKYGLFSVISMGNHASGLIFALFFLLAFFIQKRVPFRGALIIGFVATVLIGLFSSLVINYLFPIYSHHLERTVGSDRLIPILTKAYFAGFFFLFAVICKNKSVISFLDQRELFSFFLFCSCLAYFSFLIPLIANIGIFSRLTGNLTFLYIFPVYVVLLSLYKPKLLWAWIFGLMFILIPFVLKLTLFARAEYRYDWILF
jgi:hypothetical protein